MARLRLRGFNPRCLLLRFVAVASIVVCCCLRIVGVLEVVSPIEPNVVHLVVGQVDHLLLLQIWSLRHHLLIHVVLHVVLVTV